MFKPIHGCGTRKAIKELAEELNLPFDEWMQDWPIEVVDPSDIEKYINHYKLLNDDDKKNVLLDGIIQSIEDQPNEELFHKYSVRKQTLAELSKDNKVSIRTIHRRLTIEFKKEIERNMKLRLNPNLSKYSSSVLILDATFF